MWDKKWIDSTLAGISGLYSTFDSESSVIVLLYFCAVLLMISMSYLLLCRFDLTSLVRI